MLQGQQRSFRARILARASAWRRLRQDLKEQLKQRNARWRASQRRGTKRDLLHNGSFHEAVAPVLVMAQCFCLMPVRGVRASLAEELNFSWQSFRTGYCIFYMCATLLDTLLTINEVAHGKLDVRNVEPIVFHVTILMASVRFLKLARKWPALMRQWASVESQMPDFESWQQRQQLAHRIQRVTLVMITLSLTEHLLSIVSAIHFANYCPARADPIESYLYTAGSQIFYIIPYSNWLACLGKLQNVLLTFGWSYMDIFVMIVGMGLSDLLARLTRSLQRQLRLPMPENYWTQTRIQYRLIVELINDVDDAVSGIMMLSFANNLYFVCIQLLKSIK